MLWHMRVMHVSKMRVSCDLGAEFQREVSWLQAQKQTQLVCW